ncbi:MAG: MFS transporter [Thermomicrobiales bacterium]
MTTRSAARDQKPLVALLAATIISLVGSQMTLIALPWFVLSTTGSAAKAGLVGFATFLPGLVVGLFGGVLVDRLGFKRVSVVADLVSGLGIVAIPLLYDTVGLSFWQLLVLVFIGSLLKVPSLTAHRSMVPELAAHAGTSLERVNALFESSQNLALLLGTPLAGVLVASIGARNVLWLDAASFGLSALLVGLVVPSALFAQSPFASQGYLHDVMAGLKFIRRDQLLWPMVIVLAASNAISSSIGGVVLPYYVKGAFGSAASLGIMFAALGGGGFLGATLYGMVAGRVPRRVIWMGAFFIMPLEFWILTISPSVAMIVGAFFVAGIASGPLNPLMVTIRHERSPEALRGRVFSTYSAVAMAAQPLGILIAGNLIESAGFEFAVVAFALTSQVLGVLVLLIPAFRRMDALRPQVIEGAGSAFAPRA